MENNSNLTKAIEAVRAKFIHTEKFIAAVSMAVQAKKHVLLYGPPGHGKSEMSELFIKTYFDEIPYVLPMSPSIDVENLFGPVDIKRFNEENVLRYYVSEGFMSKKGVILEELFDARGPVVTALKDVITRKYLCQGTECTPSLTQLIIGCTNYTPSDWVDAAEDGGKDSREALLGRFPFYACIDWPSYKVDDYANMFAKLGVKHGDLADYCAILGEFAAQKAVITPRNAVIGFEAFKYNGANIFYNFGHIPERIVQSVVGDVEKIKISRAIVEMCKEHIRKMDRASTIQEKATAISEATKYAETTTRIPNDAGSIFNEMRAKAVKMKDEVASLLLRQASNGSLK